MFSVKKDEKLEKRLDTISSGKSYAATKISSAYFISSESDENYITEEDLTSGESDSESKLKNVSPKKKRVNQSSRTHFGRCNTIFRQRHYPRKNKNAKSVKKKGGKLNSGKFWTHKEDAVETPKKGKRCRLGGKAKGKPPEEENQEKCDSDDDDSSYFSRISLGYFQKYKDESGASTSYQMDNNPKYSSPELKAIEAAQDEMSEEMELLDLQRWGMAGFGPHCNGNIEKLSATDDMYHNTL